MRKVVFKIDDMAWMQKHYNLTDEQMHDIFADNKPFKATYTYTEKERMLIDMI